MSEATIRERIVEIGRRLYARGLIAANEGNLSVRDGTRLFVTPAGACKGYLTPDMIVEADLEGRARDSSQRVSSETRMHVAIYARRRDVSAVVHAHPPTATGFAAAGIALDRPLIAEAVLTLGTVPVVPFGMPTTGELASRVAAAICDAHALLMANHGALAVGETLDRAWERMETLEQLARVTLTTRLLGQGSPLGPAEVERLLAERAAAGYPPPRCEECPARPEAMLESSGNDKLVLSRAELARLVREAVERLAVP